MVSPHTDVFYRNLQFGGLPPAIPPFAVPSIFVSIMPVVCHLTRFSRLYQCILSGGTIGTIRFSLWALGALINDAVHLASSSSGSFIMQSAGGINEAHPRLCFRCIHGIKTPHWRDRPLFRRSPRAHPALDAHSVADLPLRHGKYPLRR